MPTIIPCKNIEHALAYKKCLLREWEKDKTEWSVGLRRDVVGVDILKLATGNKDLRKTGGGCAAAKG
jgi:hypothetical protein